MSGDVRADLIADLTYLRKGPGLTLERLRKAGTVIGACGGPDQPIETVHERLLAALRSIHRTDGGAALWVAYGLDNPSRVTELSDRRAAYSAQIGRAPYTLRAWEDRGIEELALRLMSAFYAGSPLPEELPIPHGGLLIQELVTTYLYRDRHFVESQQERLIIPLVEGAEGFVYGSYTPTELSGVTGGTVTSRDVREGSLHEIRFPERRRRGQPHRFGFREQLVEPEHGDVAAGTEDFAGQTFESPTLRYRVECCFMGETPTTVWTYDKLSRIERPGGPEEQGTIEMAGNLVAADFADLYGGLCSGIAWRW